MWIVSPSTFQGYSGRHPSCCLTPRDLTVASRCRQRETSTRAPRFSRRYSLVTAPTRSTTRWVLAVSLTDSTQSTCSWVDSRQSWYERSKSTSLLYLSRLFYFILVTKYNLKKVLLLVMSTFELYYWKCNKVLIFCDLFFNAIILGWCRLHIMALGSNSANKNSYLINM